MSTTERKVKTKFDGDAKGVIAAARAAEREMRRVERENARIQKAFDDSATKGADRVLSAFGGLTKGIFAIGTAVNSAQGIAGATSALVTMSGAALAVPGILAAGAAAGGVFALAMSGIGDAIAAEDVEKFNEATKNMAPNAVKFASAVRDQKGQLDDLKKVVQSNFFAGFDTDVKALGERYFPMLKTQSGGIATAWNAMGREAAKALLDPKAVREVDQVLSNSRKGMDELKPALANVVKGLLGISSVGSEKFPAVGRAITDVTDRFDKWVQKGIESGRINQIIDDGIDSAKQLGRVFGNLGETGSAVWRGLNSGGRDFLDGLEKSTQKLEDFFESAAGQSALKELGQDLQVAADVASDVFAAAVKQVAALVEAGGPAFREFAKSLGDTLVGAINTVGPMLTDLAKFLSDNKEVVGDLAPALLILAGTVKGLSVAKDAQQWIAGLTGTLGDGKGSGGLNGSLKALQGYQAAGFTIGSIIAVDAATNQGLSDALNHLSGFPDAAERAKRGIGPDFWSQLFQAPAAKPGDYGDIRNLPELISKIPDAFLTGPGDTVLKISSDTSQAERNLDDLKDQIRRSNEFVTINGNRVPADQALATVLRAIDAGEGTVNVNGNTIDSQRALEDLIAQINSSNGTVTVDGNDVPAGQVLFGLLRTVTGSRATMSIDANDSAAQGVVNRFITMNNGRQIDIFVNARGDAGGIASAGRLASGGAPSDARYFSGRVRGPGTPTSDTAGLFALSTEEHVWNAAEVLGAGGHAAMYRMRAMARQGRLRGFAEGGTPAYLTQTVSAPSPVQDINVSAGATSVIVMIDGQEFRGMMRTEIRQDKRNDHRNRRSGNGAL